MAQKLKEQTAVIGREVQSLVVEDVSVAELTTYDRNSRTHSESQVRQLARSITEFGFTNPVLVDEANVLIAGHGRLEASKLLGLERVPAIRLVGLTDDQKKALRIADNKLATNAGWDEDLLKLELGELNLAGFDLDLVGFSDDELADLLPAESDDESADDVPADEDVETRVKRGEVWRLGDHRLMCGDATIEADVAQLVADATVDLALTDPPYGVNVVQDDGKLCVDKFFAITKRGVYRKIIADDTTDTAREAYNVLKGVAEKLIIWCGNYFTDFLAFSDGWLVWDKRGDSGIRNSFADGEMAWCSFHTPVRIYHQLWNGMIREGEHDKRVHPTQKPVRMLSEIVRDFTKEGATVLDVFGGSGSTLVACEQTARRCLMMELDEHYCDIIIARWEALTGRKAERV